MRIVEVEPAPCQHLHATNYDPSQVRRDAPVKELPNGQLKCMDCGEFFYLSLPQPATPKYTLKEIEALAREFVDGNDASGDQDAPDAIKLRMFIGAFVAWLAKREREGLER